MLAPSLRGLFLSTSFAALIALPSIAHASDDGAETAATVSVEHDLTAIDSDWSLTSIAANEGLGLSSHDILQDVGPAAPAPEENIEPRRDYASFGEDVKAIDWELAAVGGYYTAINFSKLFKDPQAPRFKKEGWFGKDTKHMGVDKLAHAYSTYIISELLYGRLKRNTDDAPGIEWTAAALASGIMMWSEAFDSIEPDSGWSWEDVAMNTAGAGFSVLRNAVPGLDEKVDYRMMVKPNEDIYTISGQKHFEQQRYFFAIKPAGFKGMEDNPLRFTELHVGYHAKDFLYEDREAGIEPKRHIFVGVGLNFNELLFKKSKSKAARTVGEITTYFQPPYSALHVNVTE